MSSKKTKVEIPETLPMLPVRDLVIFPYMILPLYVTRESSITAVEKALAKDRLIFLTAQKNPEEELPSKESIYSVGTIAMIIRMRKLSDGRIKILIQGLHKARVLDYESTFPYFEVNLQSIPDTNEEKLNEEREILLREVKEKLEKLISLGKNISPDILLVLEDIESISKVADLVISNLGLPSISCQEVLELDDPQEKMKKISEILEKEIELLKMHVKVQGSQGEPTRSQKEFFLREQMQAIRSELGDSTDPRAEEVEELRRKVKEAQMPPPVEKEALKQLYRLERMHPDSSEASIVRGYVDWLVDLPWSVTTEDNLDLENAKKVLEEDHYGLEKIKDRILEFLAVRKLKKDVKGPILCFVGPPGVGKTSLGRSVAQAMGRKYARISLGGLKDEPEIRGHRRTYVGSMPGKIIQTLRQSKSKNPVIVLDEIDKLGSDFRGDPSSAMLEVLDPEQNSTFRDNYLNVDFDLSQVLFMATANMEENIPPALKDRMEVIHLSGYTLQDKMLISKNYLIPKQVENHGLNPDSIEFTDKGLKFLITHYTKEAGLRNLEREIGATCRKVAKNIVMGDNTKAILNEEMVSYLLGPARFLKENPMKEDQVGVVTGLAWTQVGGEILYVEALKMKGKGELQLTGQLGDVMKESAQAALSYSKSHHKELDILEGWFEKNAIHIHLPAGAIPKDGPSAGITLATAVISLMTNTPVRHDLAMTGEVTLTGRVLPVGGIKEKCLAALNHGIRNIILPILNKKDLEEIPKAIKKKINFIFVEHLDEVLSVALPQKKTTTLLREEKKMAANEDVL